MSKFNDPRNNVWRVTDTDFNRERYPEQIGDITVGDPPWGPTVERLTPKEAFNLGRANGIRQCNDRIEEMVQERIESEIDAYIMERYGE